MAGEDHFDVRDNLAKRRRSRQFDDRSSGGSNAKDGVESRLSRAVCAGEVTLIPAQQASVANWYTAESVLSIAP